MKYNYALYVVILATLSGCFTVRSNKQFSYSKIPVQQYANALNTDTPYYLIDVRTSGEYRKAHIKNAHNYDFFAFHFDRDVDTLKRNIPAFIYCHTCHRSPFAARIMKRKGFKTVYDLKGGFSQWLKASLPVDTGVVIP